MQMGAKDNTIRTRPHFFKVPFSKVEDPKRSKNYTISAKILNHFSGKKTLQNQHFRIIIFFFPILSDSKEASRDREKFQTL